MRAIHLVGTHVVAGVEPLCGRWDGMDTDWTTTSSEVTCPACVADIRLLATAGAAPVFGSNRGRWDS